jgi:hypothetical protein
MPFAKSAKATPTYFCALPGALGSRMKLRNLLMLFISTNAFAQCDPGEPLDDGELSAFRTYLAERRVIQNPEESIFRLDSSKYRGGNSRTDVYVGPTLISPRVCSLSHLIFNKRGDGDWERYERSFDYSAVVPENAGCGATPNFEDYINTSESDISEGDLLRLVEDVPRILEQARTIPDAHPQVDYALNENNLVLKGLEGPQQVDGIGSGYLLEFNSGELCATSIFLFVTYNEGVMTVLLGGSRII